jgi:hypothetical protein
MAKIKSKGLLIVSVLQMNGRPVERRLETVALTYARKNSFLDCNTFVIHGCVYSNGSIRHNAGEFELDIE